MSDEEFNPATSDDDVIYIGKRKYVAEDTRPTPQPVSREADNSAEDQATLDKLAAWVAGADNPDDPSPVRGGWISELLKVLWVDRTPAPEAGWRGMESAPKDGTPFQAWMSDKSGGRDVENCWEPWSRINPDSEVFEIWTRVDYDQEGWSSDFNPEWKPVAWQPRPLPPSPTPQPDPVKVAAQVLLAQWEDHGDGLQGELVPHALTEDGMSPYVDGKWVKMDDITAALRNLAGEE